MLGRDVAPPIVLSKTKNVARLTSEISSSARRISWPALSRGDDIGGAVMARASLATANDNPAAAPSTGIVLLRRFRFEDRLACGTEMTFQSLQRKSIVCARFARSLTNSRSKDL
jgi:hypothetical protein